EEHGADGRLLEAPAARLVELLGMVGDRAAGAAERERRADDRGIPNLADDRACLFEGLHARGPGELEADLLHRGLDQLAVLGLLDRGQLRADQLDAEAIERAVFRERDRGVERRLAAERRQERLRPLALDDAGDEL